MHYLKALASKMEINLDETHVDIEFNIRPKNPNRLIQIPQNIFDRYKSLHRNADYARYKGMIPNPLAFRVIMEANFHDSTKNLKTFKKYILTRLENFNKNS